ncbi:MAG: sensor histidine kinase [Stenotrophobium sp.]
MNLRAAIIKDTQLPQYYHALLSPVSLAAYAAWLAVVYPPLSQRLQGHLDFSAPALAGFTGQCVVLVFFLLKHRLISNFGGRWPLLSRAGILLQLAGALVACAAFNDGLQPILLLLVVPQIAIAFAMPAEIAILVATNLALFAIMRSYPPVPGVPVLTFSIAYMSLQAFGVLTLTFAARAEAARDEAVRANAELMATRQLLGEGARGDERLRLSRELHDIAGHKLTALKLQLTLAQRRGGAPATVLQESVQLADELLGDIRGIVGTLREHDGIDLKQALLALTQAIPHPRITLDLAAAPPRVADMARAQTLLRCAQEGLTNVMRHSGATRVRISLARSGEGLVLAIEDNGNGRAARLQAGNGLRGLRERLNEVGGRLEISDLKPSGLALRAILPEAQAALVPTESSEQHRHFCLLRGLSRAENSAG